MRERDTFDRFAPPERGRFGDNESERARFGFNSTGAPRKSDLVDLTMMLHIERPNAVLVSCDGDIQKAVWLPKSLIEIEGIGPNEILRNGRTRRPVKVTVPQWKAKQTGLI